MKLFAGIDGGQSSTTAVVGDETGAILGRGVAGPADEIGQDATSTRLREALETAVARALENAGLANDTVLEDVVAGISGYDGKVRGVPPMFQARHVRLLHDAPIAHAGAFDGKAGVLVIAGTGSVAYGVDGAGRSATVGGWGYLFGDEGSAFWIARAAVELALDLEDVGKTSDTLVAATREYFGTASVREMSRAYYRKEMTRNAVAGFAKPVLDLSEEGNDRCKKIARGAAQELAELASACAKAMADEKSEVAFVGGLIQHPWFSQLVDSKLRMLRVRPVHEPEIGALLLARAHAR